MTFAKCLITAFFIEHLRRLLLQVLYQKAFLKNFANFTRVYCYWSPFLSRCWLINCNFVKISGSGRRVRLRCFAVNFVKFFRAILCRTTFNDWFWTLRGGAENKCSRNLKFTVQVIVKALRNKCSGKRFWCLMNYILQIIWSN